MNKNIELFPGLIMFGTGFENIDSAIYFEGI
jgi:hypothetical protein